MPTGAMIDTRGWEGIEHFSFHVHVDFDVVVSGCGIGMTKPIADGVEVISGTKEVHGCGMAQSMRGDTFGLDVWLSTGCKRDVFLDDISDSETSYGPSMSIEEQVFITQSIILALTGVGLDGVNGFWPEGTDARLSALAQESHVTRWMKKESIHGDRGDFGCTGASIVEEQEDCCISQPRFFGEVYRGQ